MQAIGGKAISPLTGSMREPGDSAVACVEREESADASRSLTVQSALMVPGKSAGDGSRSRENPPHDLHHTFGDGGKGTFGDVLISALPKLTGPVP